MIVRDATADTLRAFYGRAMRCRAWVAIDGDRVVAAAGFKVENGRVHVFADLGPEIRRHPIKMLRCGRRLMAEARAKGMPVAATADPNVPRSREFLERLGFVEQ